MNLKNKHYNETNHYFVKTTAGQNHEVKIKRLRKWGAVHGNEIADYFPRKTTLSYGTLLILLLLLHNICTYIDIDHIMDMVSHVLQVVYCMYIQEV